MREGKDRDSTSLVVLTLIVLTLMWGLLFLAPVYGQKVSSTLTGQITDPSGGAIVAAKVSARNVATSVERDTVTNERGNYTIQFLNPGTYEISVEQQGFKRQTFNGVVLQVDQTVELNATLELGQLLQEVSVNAAAPLLQTIEGSVGNVIAQKQVQDLPLNGREFLQLALLVPGSVMPPTGTRAPQRGTLATVGLNFNGNREGANQFLIDGTINTDPSYNSFVISPNVDSIQEFKVQTNSYSAEFGQQAGGQINLVTRGGTNQYHGGTYEYIRNSALDAKNLFDLPAPAKIPHYSQNQFGATFGGPLRKNKTFVFGSYEGFRSAQAQTSIVFVPDPVIRGGDFSRYRDTAGNLHVIYDPLTTRANPNYNPALPPSPSNPQYLRDPFPGNIIPQNRIDPIAKGILGYTESPNLGLYPLGQGRFLNNESARNTNDQYSVRVDHTLGVTDQLFGRYSFSDERALVPGALHAGGSVRQPRPQIATIGYTHFFNSSIANDFRVGYTRFRMNLAGIFAFTENIAKKLGVNDQEGLPPSAWAVPRAGEFSGGDSSLSLPSAPDPQVIRDNTVQFTDALTLNRGSHNLSMGFQFAHYQLNNASLIAYIPSYSLRATPYTADVGNPMGIGAGSAFADFLLGISHLNQLTKGSGQVYLRRNTAAPWFEDSWRIIPNLTITYGLRWDLITPFVEKDDRVGGMFVPGVNGPAQPIRIRAGIDVSGVGRIPRAIVDTNYRNWAPRLGFAYRVGGSNKTVVRGGYGVFYNTQVGNTTTDFVRNPPFQERWIITAPDSINPYLTLKDLLPLGPLTISQSAFGFGQVKDGTIELPTPMIQQWNFSMQREILANWALTGAYVGSTGRHLGFSSILNIPYPGPGSRDVRRPFVQTLGSTIFQFLLPRVNSYYHSLQVTSEQRNLHGLTMLTAYTFSKSIDTGEEITSGGDARQTINNWNLDGENRGRSNFDVRHRLVNSFLYELPVGSGKRFLGQGGPAGRIFGGWQVNAISTVSSGIPVMLYSGVDTANTALGSLTHPNSVPGVNPIPAEQTADHWLNPAAFTLAPDCRDEAVFKSLSNPLVCFGSTGRNVMSRPGVVNFDASLLKNVPVRDRGTLQFRTEVFNLFNTPPLGRPANNLSSPNAGQILSAGRSRQIQFSLRYSF